MEIGNKDLVNDYAAASTSGPLGLSDFSLSLFLIFFLLLSIDVNLLRSVIYVLRSSSRLLCSLEMRSDESIMGSESRIVYLLITDKIRFVFHYYKSGEQF